MPIGTRPLFTHSDGNQQIQRGDARTDAVTGICLRAPGQHDGSSAYPDLPEAEVVREWWGEHAPSDLTAMLVMLIGEGDRTIAIPLSEAEESK